jgi:hypothetical protein
VDDFRKDWALLVKNAATYNGTDSFVYQDAELFDKIVHKAIAQLERSHAFKMAARTATDGEPVDPPGVLVPGSLVGGQAPVPTKLAIMRYLIDEAMEATVSRTHIEDVTERAEVVRR